jgi:hypothetical protein
MIQWTFFARTRGQRRYFRTAFFQGEVAGIE